MINLDSVLERRDITLLTKVHIVKAIFFFSSHLLMWELDHKEVWVPKNWCFWAVVLEKTLKSPLASKEIKPINLKGNHPWIFIGKNDAEAEAPIVWPPDVKNWLLRKDPNAGKNWRQEEKGMTEDKMVGWLTGFRSLTGWTWVWASFRSWWWTGKPRVLQSMGSKRVGCDWATELSLFAHKAYKTCVSDPLQKKKSVE